MGQLFVGRDAQFLFFELVQFSEIVFLQLNELDEQFLFFELLLFLEIVFIQLIEQVAQFLFFELVKPESFLELV